MTLNVYIFGAIYLIRVKLAPVLGKALGQGFLSGYLCTRIISSLYQIQLFQKFIQKN